MEEMICIELKETTLEKLEAIARWKAKQEGKAVSVLMSGDDDTRLRNEAQACGAVFCCKTDYDLIARINEMVG